MQQWIARGYPTPKAVLKAVKVAALAGPEADVAAAAAAGGEAGAPEQQAIQREVFKVVASSSSVEGYGSQPSKGKAKRGSKKGSGKGFSRR
jgi:ribosomal protein L4